MREAASSVTIHRPETRRVSSLAIAVTACEYVKYETSARSNETTDQRCSSSSLKVTRSIRFGIDAGSNLERISKIFVGPAASTFFFRCENPDRIS